MGEDFKNVPGRVIAPDAGVDRDAVLIWRTWLADAGMGENTVAAVQPAIGSPGESVERFVGVLVAPAVEENLRLAGRVGLLIVRDEEKVRGGTDPDAAETEFDARDHVQTFEEHGLLVELAVAIGVFEDQDLVAGARRT